MPSKRRDLERSEPTGIFLVPEEEGKFFFCLCHQEFWDRESDIKRHMESSNAKKAAGRKAIQCDHCFRWFRDKHWLKHHQEKVNHNHSLPDVTDYVDVAVEVIQEDGEIGLQMQPRKVLLLNTEKAQLDTVEPKSARLRGV